MELPKIVQEIQYMLTPAIMVSSASLLLLGFQNKFSALFNRFRALNEERRRLTQKEVRNSMENTRLENLKKQLSRLMKRATHVKNAILLTYSAILCFVLTSLLLFLNTYTALRVLSLTILFFLTGLLLVLLSSIFMMIEVGIAFNILRLEKKS